MFTHSAVTPPKMNRFGRNLEHSDHIVGSWPWQILGAIRAVATVWEAAEILFFVSLQFLGLATSGRHNYTIIKIAENLIPNGPRKKCLVSILPLESIQSLSPVTYAPYKKRTSYIFGNVRCPILGKPRMPLHLSGCQHGRKADWIGNWK